MNQVWKDIVRKGLRNQDLLCLHDYYDFHRNYEKLNLVIREQIIKHQYKPKPPTIIRLEKKYGVCRHLQIPDPSDAVVLQTLVQNLEPHILASSPTPTRAFYSRSHTKHKSEADIDDTFPYAWWELWGQFQKRIYEFSDVFDYVVVTDISNYFDTISFERLRNVLSSYGKFDECLIDFLFFMLDSFMWKPDYLPLSGLGLPQIHFDAPRLLAHAFLFEVDKYLNKETQGNFVRWMDDIDFAVQDIESAKKILRGLDELLLTRGLRLNLGKTKILSAEEAKMYFLPNENRYLTIMSKRVERRIKSGLDISDEKQKIRKRFRDFLKLPHVGRWEKVYKRYFTISGKTKDPFLARYVPELLENNPDIRTNILRYYEDLGINIKRFEHLRNFIKSQHCLDDVAIFSAAKLLTDWVVSSKSKIRKEIVDLAISIAGLSFAHLISSIWLLSKYGSSSELVSILDTTSYLWKNSGFLSRQVAATIPKIRDLQGNFLELEKTFGETGQLDSLRIMYNLNQLRAKPLTSAENLYIMHKSENDYYPLNKFIITLDLLSSPAVDTSTREKLRSALTNRIKDPIYIEQINKIRIE